MRNQGLGSWLTRKISRFGDKVAVIDGDRQVTYSELDERSRRFASALSVHGVTPGQRVAFLGENSPEFIEALFGTSALGAVFVPVNTRLAAPEIAYQLEDAGVSVLVHDEKFADLAAQATAERPTLLRWTIGDEATDDAQPLSGLLAEAEPWTEDVPVTLDDLAVILYTSGTTGRPKGACLTHGNFTWNAFNMLVDYDVSSDDISLMISPLFHVASLGMGVLPTLLKGATMVLEAKFDPGRALMLIETHGVTWLSGVPTTFQLMCEHPDWQTRDVSTLSTLTCGGSAIPRRVYEAFQSRGLTFTANYGMTETSPGTTYLPASRSQDKAGSAGLPHFFTDVRIVDLGGEAVQPGVAGEILISGPNVIDGYWRRPDAANSFEDGWFHSGDLGYLDEEGFLYVSDRLKDMFVSGGENVYPAEIEALLFELPEIASAAVVGVPHERWGEVPHAIIVPHVGFDVTPERVQQHLEGRLARYKIPKTVTIQSDLPRTASGKIRKNVLRQETPHA